MIQSCWKQMHLQTQSRILKKMNPIWNFGNDDLEIERETLMDYEGPVIEMCVELETEMHVQLENQACVDYWWDHHHHWP